MAAAAAAAAQNEASVINALAPRFIDFNPSENNRVTLARMTKTGGNPARAFLDCMKSLEPNGEEIENYIKNGKLFKGFYFQHVAPDVKTYTTSKSNKDEKQRYAGFKTTLDQWEGFKGDVIKLFGDPKNDVEKVKEIMRKLTNIFSAEVLAKIPSPSPPPPPQPTVQPTLVPVTPAATPPSPLPPPPQPPVQPTVQPTPSGVVQINPKEHADINVGWHTVLTNEAFRTQLQKVLAITAYEFRSDQQIVKATDMPEIGATNNLRQTFDALLIVLVKALTLGRKKPNKNDIPPMITAMQAFDTTQQKLAYISAEVTKLGTGSKFYSSPDRRLIYLVIHLYNSWAMPHNYPTVQKIPVYEQSTGSLETTRVDVGDSLLLF